APAGGSHEQQDQWPGARPLARLHRRVDAPRAVRLEVDVVVRARAGRYGRRGPRACGISVAVLVDGEVDLVVGLVAPHDTDGVAAEVDERRDVVARERRACNGEAVRRAPDGVVTAQ